MTYLEEARSWLCFLDLGKDADDADDHTQDQVEGDEELVEAAAFILWEEKWKPIIKEEEVNDDGGDSENNNNEDDYINNKKKSLFYFFNHIFHRLPLRKDQF